MSTKNNQSRAPDLDKYIKSSKKHRYVSYYQGAQLYNMGYSLFVRTAKLAGANLPIRKTTIVDLNILDTYLETQAKIKEKEEIDKEEAEEMMREEIEHIRMPVSLFSCICGGCNHIAYESIYKNS
ncbi:MAG: DUF6462 family protein [Bacillota bacterium]|nr:DUF6462 family protein [Bacillota bacterium]